MTDHAVSHITVFGVGGVGGYFGGRIAAALAAQPDPAWQVHFVARGDHLGKIRERGLVLDAAGERMTCRPASAVEALADAPIPDVVLVCVKGYDLDDAARQIAAHSHEGTVVIPLQNGVDAADRIRAHMSRGYVLPACVFVGTRIEEPGVVVQTGPQGTMLLGADPAHAGFAPTEFLALLDRAGVAYVWSEDSRPALWDKFLFIAPFGLVTAASGKTIGQVLIDADLMEEVTGIAQETLQVALAEGVDMGEEPLDRALSKARGFPFDTKTSLQRDVEARRRHEGDLFGGTVIRLGARHGIPTPVTGRVYSRIALAD